MDARALTLVLVLVGCSGASDRDGGMGGGSSGSGGGTAGGSAGTWLLSLTGVVRYGASVTIGTDQVIDPGGASSQSPLPASVTWEASKSSGGATGHAKLVLTRDAHQLTLTGDVSGTSPGTPAFSALAEVRDLTLCVTAPGATRVRVTYACDATPQFTGHGLAGLTVASGATTYCDLTAGETRTRMTRMNLVTETMVEPGENCWSEGTTFQFIAGGGQSPGGTASVTGTVTFRVDPL
ncbi:MAG: hypothetical protein JNJ54_20450 [Myxococcaceae bacterium]|nr:hypothetical protein [Myxococcaceae bacterium]